MEKKKPGKSLGFELKVAPVDIKETTKQEPVDYYEFNDELKSTILKKHNFTDRDI